MQNRIDVIQLEDGFYYFDPVGNCGVFSSSDLRKMADHLDKLNAPWQKEIEDYFTANPDTTDRLQTI